MHYKINNLPRYFNHTTLKKTIEKELDLQNSKVKLNYKLKQDYALFEIDKIIEKNEITIRKNICPIKKYNKKLKQIELDDLNTIIDIRDNVTPLWKMGYEEQIFKKKSVIEKFYQQAVNYYETNFFYRNNCQFSFGYFDSTPVLGFKSNTLKNDLNLVYDVSNCPNVSENMKNKVNIVNELIKNKKELIYNRKEKNGILRLLMIKENGTEDIALLQIYDPKQVIENVFNNKTNESQEQNELIDFIKLFPFQNLYLQINNGAFDGFISSPIYQIHGKDFLIIDLLSFKFKISFFSFFQINCEIAELICKKIKEKGFKNDQLLDLCCGSGFFGIILHANFRKVIGIEINDDCIKDAHENIKINNINNYTVLKKNVESENFYEKATVILDPPRNGVSKKTIQNIRRNKNINEIFYISCDYNQSYGNILDLCKETSSVYQNDPFRIASIEGFDMFPNTEKSEVLIHLVRD